MEEKDKRINVKLIVIVVTLCLLLVVYLGGVFYFKDRFLANTYVNGVNVSYLNLESAKDKVQTLLDNYKISIKARESEPFEIVSNDINIKYDFDETAKEAMRDQNFYLWFSSFFKTTEHEVNTKVTFDDEALEKKFNEMSFLHENDLKKPEDARISEYDIDKGYSIIPEYLVNYLEVEVAKELIKDSIMALKDNVDLEELYLNPSIYSDNESLNNAINQMNTITSTTIRYVGNTALDGTISNQWLSYDGANVNVDDDKIREFVIALADKYDTANRPRKFMTAVVGEVELPASKEGWLLDREGEFNQIKSELARGTTIDREPIFKQRGVSLEQNEFGNTYVEIDLTNQHLYYYKDGQMIIDSPIVTGNVSRGRGTPAGVFKLRGKMRNAVLRGRDYAAPVSYWMPFNGGIGMHDAKWRGSFGGSIYVGSGSHGCVNMPFSQAKALFENISSGCPVICYKTNVRAVTNVKEFQAAQPAKNVENNQDEAVQ